MRINCVKILSIVSLLISSTLFCLNLSGLYRPKPAIGKNPEKEIHHALYGPQQGKIIETRWSAFGQTDLVRYDNSPEYMDIYVDGTAGTPMFKFNGDLSNPDSVVNRLKIEFPGYFPFMFLKDGEKDSALIIGPGGGRDILLAAMGGVKKITAVEVNKDLVEMVRDYSWYNGHIYNGFGNVNIIVDEGRNFLRRQKENFDIIMLSLPVTNTSRSREGYALTENYLLTTDSINDYLNHLTENGRLVIVGHGDLSMLRLLSISLATLGKRGLDSTRAMKHMYLVGSRLYPVFVLKKTPFLQEEIFPRYRAMFKFGYDPLSSYFPFIQRWGTLNPALMSLGRGLRIFDEVLNEVEKLGHDISPVSDNSPFFYKFENGIPKPVSRVFVFSIVSILVIITVWSSLLQNNRYRIRKYSNKTDKATNPILHVVIFLMLGMGFMMVEISLIQKFVLFLGRPVLSMTVLLFSILGGAGMGSFWSKSVATDRSVKTITTAAFVTAILLLLYTFALKSIFSYFLGLDLAYRVLITVGLVIPLGFAMGFPFPLAIRFLKERLIDYLIPLMWGINGISSVMGSALTVIIAIDFGFTQVFLTAAGCYLSVSLIFKLIH